MPSAAPKSTMSLGELALCEDFLEGHRDYAADLFSNVEKIRQWHEMDGCSETLEGRSCTICELCNTDGLLGATKKALVSYSDADKHLREVRASLGETAPGRGSANEETFFKSSLAKAVFLCIVTAGDNLRSQHATWQARLQSELGIPPSSDQSSERIAINTGLSGLDKNKIGNGGTPRPTHLDSKSVGLENKPGLVAVPGDWVPESTKTTSKSTVIVFKRCLSPDCPCEANKAGDTLGASLADVCGMGTTSNLPPSSSSSKKSRISNGKTSAKSNATARASGSGSTTTNLVKSKTNAQTQEQGTHHDLNSPQDAMRAERTPSSAGSEMTLSKEESESLSDPEPIIDPRIFRLRAQIARSDDARQALVKWCRAQERYGTGSEASITPGSTTKDTGGYPSALACGFETPEYDKGTCVTSQSGDVAAHGTPSPGNDTTGEQQQKELKRLWLVAQKKRRKDRKRLRALA